MKITLRQFTRLQYKNSNIVMIKIFIMNFHIIQQQVIIFMKLKKITFTRLLPKEEEELMIRDK